MSSPQKCNTHRLFFEHNLPSPLFEPILSLKIVSGWQWHKQLVNITTDVQTFDGLTLLPEGINLPVYMWLFQSESLAVNHSSGWLDDWFLCLEISLSQNCLIYWSDVFPILAYKNVHFALSLCFLQSRWLGDSFCLRRNLYKWTVVWGPQLFTMKCDSYAFTWRM